MKNMFSILVYIMAEKKKRTNWLFERKKMNIIWNRVYKNNHAIKNPSSYNSNFKDYYKIKLIYSYSINKSKHHHEKYELVEFEDE